MDYMKKEEKLIKDVRNAMGDSEVEDRRLFFEQCVAVLVVPQQLREMVADMFLTEDEISSYPKLKIKSMSDTIPVEVIVEGVSFCECSDLVTGIAIMMAAYYIVNIAYPPKLKSTLFFYQKAILGIADSSANDGKVARLLTTLLTHQDVE